MSWQRRKGTAFESMVVDYLNARFETDRFHRLGQMGANDEGDVWGLFAWGRRVVVECKNVVNTALWKWCGEAEAEAGNADALGWIVVHKRKGAGVRSFGTTYVTTTLETFCALMTGESQREFEERKANGGSDVERSDERRGDAEDGLRGDAQA